MSVLKNLVAPSEARSTDWFSGTLTDLLAYFQYEGLSYPLGLNQTLTGSEESVPNSFVGYSQAVYKRSGVVASTMLARRHVFAQLRLMFQDMADGRPGRLRWDPALEPFERPWSGGTTSDLLSKMLDHADLAGNGYVTPNRYGNLKVVRPDWMTILMGSREEMSPEEAARFDPNDIDAELVGYVYRPPNSKGRILLPNEVAHFAPEPDPEAQYRGMSWLTPVIRNVQAHNAASEHKSKFFTNGATPNMVLAWDAAVKVETLRQFKELFEEEHQGLANAYKTMFLGGGADVTVVGQDFKQLDFKTVQGTDETLIAAAGGVPPVIAGLSEGLQAATYSNYGQAKRQFGDTTIYHLGQNVCASLETIVKRPTNTRLWFDSDTPFFRDDAKAEADVRFRDGMTLRNYIDAGWEPESAKQAVLSGDISGLKHSGLYSVQLQRPGSDRSITVPIRAATELLSDGWEIVATTIPEEEDD